MQERAKRGRRPKDSSFVDLVLQKPPQTVPAQSVAIENTQPAKEANQIATDSTSPMNSNENQLLNSDSLSLGNLSMLAISHQSSFAPHNSIKSAKCSDQSAECSEQSMQGTGFGEIAIILVNLVADISIFLAKSFFSLLKSCLLTLLRVLAPLLCTCFVQIMVGMLATAGLTAGLASYLPLTTSQYFRTPEFFNILSGLSSCSDKDNFIESVKELVQKDDELRHAGVTMTYLVGIKNLRDVDLLEKCFENNECISVRSCFVRVKLAALEYLADEEWRVKAYKALCAFQLGKRTDKVTEVDLKECKTENYTQCSQYPQVTQTRKQYIESVLTTPKATFAKISEFQLAGNPKAIDTCMKLCYLWEQCAQFIELVNISC